VTGEKKVTISVYLRREEPKSAEGMQDAMGDNDIRLGVVEFVPNLDMLNSADEWYDFVSGTGRIQVSRTPRTFSQALSCSMRRSDGATSRRFEA
jgi:hypothetical protein